MTKIFDRFPGIGYFYKKSTADLDSIKKTSMSTVFSN